MNMQTSLRTLPAALAIALAGLALNVSAQNASPTGPSTTPGNQAGEAYPNDPNAANPNKPKAEIVKKAENSKVVKATKRTTKKATNAVKSGAKKTAAAVTNVGEDLNKKIPPGPNDPKK
jgi:hypothetical protein